MREIKFRGKEFDTNEWVYGYYAEANGHLILKDGFKFGFDYNGISDDDYYEIILETVGQFTGLYDKNNTPIYEGDIVSLINEDKIFSVYYDDTKIRFVFKDKYNINRNVISQNKIEVIGNIYEHPHLLKEE